MKIIDLLKSPKVCVSCELFPPKKGSELEHAQEIVRTIAIQGVDYMSVTYGAGGTAVGKSVALVSEIERCGVPAPEHPPAVELPGDPGNGAGKGPGDFGERHGICQFGPGPASGRL